MFYTGSIMMKDLIFFNCCVFYVYALVGNILLCDLFVCERVVVCCCFFLYSKIYDFILFIIVFVVVAHCVYIILKNYMHTQNL